MESVATMDAGRLQPQAKVRSPGLDILKCIAMFFVVWNHSPMPQGCAGVFRAVSIFFMITGYFYQSTKDKGREMAQLKKMVYMYIYANIAYFFIMALYNGGFSGILTLKNVLTHFLLGDGLTIGVLWYQHAIVVVLLIVYAADKTKMGRKILYPLVPVLLLGNICLGKYSYVIFGTVISGLVTRNFLFYGLPFFLLGDMLRCVKSHWIGKRKEVLIALCAALMLSVAEYFLILDMPKGGGHLYIMSSVLMPLVFMLALTEGKRMGSTGGALEIVGGFLAKIGHKHTMVIYLVHPAVLGAIKVFVQWILPGCYDFYVKVSAIVIFAASCIVSVCWSWLYERIKAKRIQC